MKEKIVAKHNQFAEDNNASNRKGWQFVLGYGDYLNYGYWTDQTETGWQACETMLERLLAHVPEKRGRILDVACGMGATSLYLTRYYPPEAITGINISDAQIAACRNKVPGARFEVMRAEKLDFDDESLDTVMCIEAAFHFETRLDFLKEARRVLKPGGALLLSDIFADTDHPLQAAANRVGSIEAYRDVYHAAGFTEVEIEDATEPCVMRMTDVIWTRLKRMRADGRVTDEKMLQIRRKLASRRRALTYVLAVARKT